MWTGGRNVGASSQFGFSCLISERAPTWKRSARDGFEHAPTKSGTEKVGRKALKRSIGGVRARRSTRRTDLGRCLRRQKRALQTPHSPAQQFPVAEPAGAGKVATKLSRHTDQFRPGKRRSASQRASTAGAWCARPTHFAEGVAISLGVGITDGEKGEVHVPIRFRTTIKNAKHIRDTLTRLVAEAEQPA